MTEAPSIRRPDERARAARTRRRHAAERRFQLYGIAAIAFAMLFLGLLLSSIVLKGYGAFFQTSVRLDISFQAQVIDPELSGDPAVWAKADYGRLIVGALRARFPDVTARRELRALLGLVSRGARFELRDKVLADPSVIGTVQPIWLTASDEADMFNKGAISREVPETERILGDREIAWLDRLDATGALRLGFNIAFFTHGDSREPEQAGVWGAVVGSFYALLVTLVIAFPLGVMTAIYLEEFAPKDNRWVDLIEININNLAAVPSIVFGLLGLAVFLNFFGLPRSAPLVGGMTLALMTLPVIIIATRAALGAVPPSIRDAARGLGSSPVQVVLHHVLPLGLPGILTGAIIGMARALGETAPLLMIGMVAFIVDVPASPVEPATALPVLIYLWADSPELAFAEKTAAATLVLLLFLVVMNGLAVFLRHRFEKRW